MSDSASATKLNPAIALFTFAPSPVLTGLRKQSVASTSAQ